MSNQPPLHTKTCEHCASRFRTRYPKTALCRDCRSKRDAALSEYDLLKAKAKLVDKLQHDNYRLSHGIVPSLPPEILQDIRRLAESSTMPESQRVLDFLQEHFLEKDDLFPDSDLPPWE
jgi:hypothetical protein